MRRISKAGTETREAGYTYLSVLAMLLAVGMAAQTATIPSESARIRDAEAELLFRGLAYRDAIASYWAAGGDAPRLPGRLTDLLEDDRDGRRRHIRQLYPDPLSGARWTLIAGPDGGIAGVASSSAAAPRKRAFFPVGLEAFAEAESYADWRFVFEPG